MDDARIARLDDRPRARDRAANPRRRIAGHLQPHAGIAVVLCVGRRVVVIVKDGYAARGRRLEVVGDAGLTIDWNSDEQHVAAYEKYYFNEELRKDFGRRAKERAETFSWEKTVDKVVGVMKERN